MFLVFFLAFSFSLYVFFLFGVKAGRLVLFTGVDSYLDCSSRFRISACEWALIWIDHFFLLMLFYEFVSCQYALISLRGLYEVPRLPSSFP